MVNTARLLHRVLTLLVLSLLTLGAGSASAQVDWPTPPENWWTGLDGGGSPSATFEANMGMVMTITQTVDAVEGTQITLSTAMSMMGNALPGQSQVIDAATLTPEGSIAMMQRGFGGAGMVGGAGVQNPQQALEDLEAVIQEVARTTCQVGDLQLECTEYDVSAEGMTSRVWHAPAVPPVLMGGVVRVEATVAGQPFTMNMTSYTGSLMP